MLTSIISAVAILGLLVLVHEAGHFLVAKRCGVRVLRFSIGYPPKLFGIRRGETEYSIGAVPFGGYVRMLGDEIGDELSSGDIEVYLNEIGRDLTTASARSGSPENGSASPESELQTLANKLGASDLQRNGTTAAIAALGRELRPEEAMLLDEIRSRGSVPEAIKALAESRPAALIKRIQARAFPSQSLAKRLAIVLAGPVANILFAPILLTFVFMYGVPHLVPVLGQIKKGLPAEVAGLKSGDLVLSIDGKEIWSWDDLSSSVRRSAGAQLRIEIERGADNSRTRSVVLIKPAYEADKTAFGGTVHQWVIGVLPRGDLATTRTGPISAVGYALAQTADMTVMLVSGVAKIVTGATPVREALGGPIMIAQMAGQQAHEGFANLAFFTVMLSLELGIINLLPVPMLDGGHLAFFLIEGVRGKPLKVRHREIAQQVGLILLAGLMAFVIFNDISRIVQG